MLEKGLSARSAATVAAGNTAAAMGSGCLLYTSDAADEL